MGESARYVHPTLYLYKEHYFNDVHRVFLVRYNIVRVSYFFFSLHILVSPIDSWLWVYNILVSLMLDDNILRVYFRIFKQINRRADVLDNPYTND